MNRQIMRTENIGEFRIAFLCWKLAQEYGVGVRARGRHPNRRAVLPFWHRGAQNDVPIRYAEELVYYTREDRPVRRRVQLSVTQSGGIKVNKTV